MRLVLTFLLLFSTQIVFGYEYFQANSVWMPLEQVEALPQEGYALEVRDKVSRGYYDGVLVYERSEEKLVSEVEITEKHLDTGEVTTRIYRDGRLVEERRSVEGGIHQYSGFSYAPGGELEEISHFEEDTLQYQQLMFYNRDGSLRSIYRFKHDTLLQVLSLEESGYTVGTDERLVREHRDENTMVREYISEGSVVYRLKETLLGETLVIVETRYNPYREQRQEYRNDLLMLHRNIRDGSIHEIRYGYDEFGRKIREQIKETQGSQTRHREITYEYDKQTGALLQQKSMVDKELREIIFYQEDGAQSRREVYRGGMLLLRYDYE